MKKERGETIGWWGFIKAGKKKRGLPWWNGDESKTLFNGITEERRDARIRWEEGGGIKANKKGGNSHKKRGKGNIQRLSLRVVCT